MSHRHSLRAALLALLWAYPVYAQAQVSQQGPTLNVSSIHTELKASAIKLGISYAQAWDSTFKVQDIHFNAPNGGNALFQLTPEIEVLTGTADAFSSIIAKAQGFAMFFRDTTVAGLRTVNTRRIFHLMPVSAGIESNNTFDVINGIAEVGYAPWYQLTGNRQITPFMRATRVGVFLQGGYKFRNDTTGQHLAGGETNQSREQGDHIILRTKGSFVIDSNKPIIHLGFIQAGLVGSADVWLDFINGAWYQRLQGKLRLYMPNSPTRPGTPTRQYFDLEYQKGSGAPNFNQGDQYGIGLTVAF